MINFSLFDEWKSNYFEYLPKLMHDFMVYENSYFRDKIAFPLFKEYGFNDKESVKVYFDLVDYLKEETKGGIK